MFSGTPVLRPPGLAGQVWGWLWGGFLEFSGPDWVLPHNQGEAHPPTAWGQTLGKLGRPSPLLSGPCPAAP